MEGKTKQKKKKYLWVPYRRFRLSLIERLRSSLTWQMNSTVNGWEPPLQPISSAAVGIVWANLAFCLFSLGILVYKLAIDPSYLRLACFIMGLVTFGTAIVNRLHISMSIPFFLDIITRLVVLSFIDLVVAVSFIISSRFYRNGHHINIMYYVALATVVAVNILSAVSLLKRLLAPEGYAMLVLSIVTRVSLFVAVVLSYSYAFQPVVFPNFRNSTSPVAITVGVW